MSEILMEKKTKALEAQCKDHEGYPANMLNLTENQTPLKICQMCLQQQDILTSNFQPIKEIFDADTNTIFKYYPPLSNSQITQQIKQLQAAASKQKETIQKNYEDFFAALTKELNNVRAKCQDEINQIDMRVNSVLELYREIVQIDKLKAALLGGDESYQELQNIVSTNVKDKSTNSTNLQAYLNKFEAYLKSYSDTNPKKLQEQIITNLRNISFFSLFSQDKKSFNESQSQTTINPSYEQGQLDKGNNTNAVAQKDDANNSKKKQNVPFSIFSCKGVGLMILIFLLLPFFFNVKQK